MKKIITLFFTIIAAYSANSQVLLSEDFQNGFPNSFTIYDEDGNTVDPNLSAIFPDAWVTFSFSNFEPQNAFAASTSVYSPTGTSDDWMVTSSIQVVNSTFLFWRGIANNNSANSYEVLISTTGNQVADFTTLLGNYSESPNWSDNSVDLSSYDGQTVYLAWRNTSSGLPVLGIDDIEVSVVNALNLELTELTTENIQSENSAATVEGLITNKGSEVITSLDVSYSVNGGAATTQTLTGLNIASFGEYSFTVNSTFNPSGAGSFSDLKVWTSNPNGGVDADPTNDSLDQEFWVNKGLTVSKKVLVEEFTTVPCGFCPNVVPTANYILDNVPGSILVGLHACFNTDAMTIPEASELCRDLGSGSAPAGMIDRIVYEGNSTPAFGINFNNVTPPNNPWTIRAQDREDAGSILDVFMEGNYNDVTRRLDVEVRTSFVDFPLPGDIGISLMIVEDSVTGTGSGYDQRNFYNNTAGHPFQGIGDPITGYIHEHVLRDVLPSTYGDQSIIPANPALNTRYDRNFSTTLSNGFDENQVYLVGVVGYRGSSLNGYEVLNAYEVKLTDLLNVGINENKNSKASIEIYPNPSNTIANVSIELTETNNIQLDVMDITGKVIMTDDLGVMAKGSQLIQVNVANLANGFYFLNLRVGDEIITKKITVAK